MDCKRLLLINKKNTNLFSLFLFIILFTSTTYAQFIVNNDATKDDCNCYTLTYYSGYSLGTVWNQHKISLNNPFDFTFEVYLGNDANGADGIAFALQPIGTSVGNSGGGMGIGNVSPSVAVTIDTYQNAGSNDPPYDHIAIQLNGDVDHTSSNNIAGPVQASVSQGNIKDGAFHVLRIVWNPVGYLLEVYFDGDLRVQSNYDFVTQVFGGDSEVYWGFTGSTGGAMNLQRFCTKNLALFSLEDDKTSYCVGEEIDFIDASTSSGNIISWSWDFDDGTISTDPSPSHSFDTPGNYEVTLEIVGDDGCDSEIYIVEIEITEPITIQQEAILCNEDSGYTLPDGDVVYEIGTYYTTVSSVSGCDTMYVTELIAPDVDFGILTNDTIICIGDQIELRSNVQNAYRFYWEPSSSLSDVNIPNPMVNPTSLTEYVLMADIVVGDNLVENGDFEQGNVGFTSGYNYNSGSSLGGPGHYTVNSTVSNGWWGNCGDHTSGSGNMIIVDGANGDNGVPAQSSLWCQNISILPNTDYVFSVWLTNANSSGQTSQLGFFINGIQIGANQTTPINPCGWNEFFVIWNSGIQTGADICIIEMSGQQPGNDFAIDDISFRQMCTFYDTITVEVNKLPVANFEGNAVCYQSESELTDLSYDLNGGEIVSWEWDFGNGPESTLQNPSYTFDLEGEKNVHLTVESEFGCVNDTLIEIMVHSLPQSDFQGINLEGCSPICPELVATTSIGGNDVVVEYQWKTSDGREYISDLPNWGDCFENNGEFTQYIDVTLISVTDKGCRDVITKNSFIQIYHNPIVDFYWLPENPSILNSQVDFINVSKNATSFEWYVDGSLYTTTNVHHEFESEHEEYTITLSGETSAGCRDTIVKVITIEDELLFYVPNTFTPDADNHNEMFMPVFTSGFDRYDYHFTIYNRWGEIIFESFDSSLGWDGTYGSQVAKTGTYVWTIEFKEMMTDARHYRNGVVNLLR